jgi:pimeloyl-ACP methyl ester carboxylesterase
VAIALTASSFGPGIVSASPDASSHAVSPAHGDTGVDNERARSGLIEIGTGRDLFLECRGVGGPTVVLVSGTQGASDEWTHVFEAGVPTPSDAAVMPAVARFTRVCAYDRPGTTRFDGEVTPSSPVAQPTTAEVGVADLRALLTAAAEPGPYVLVGASWGGLIVKLFASRHPTDVAGLVFVDGASEMIRQTFTQAQWDGWMEVIETSATSPGLERPAYAPSVEALQAAPPAPRVPAIVLTAEREWDLQVGGSGSTWPAWLAAQELLAASLHAQHITDTDSGHAIGVERPALVVDAIRRVVLRERTGSIWMALALVLLPLSSTLASTTGDDPAGTSNDEPSASHGDFAGSIDIGGREIYLECRGQGAPLVLLLSGLDASADLWHRPEQPEPTVFNEVARFSRVCAYDRPGTPVGDGDPSRSDPVPMPITTRDSADDLVALIDAADMPRPFVIAAHSYAGLYARLFASENPQDVAGIVFVDVLTPELQEEMTPDEWEIWKRVNARREEDIASYPDLERLEFQPSVDIVRAAPKLRPMPVIVLSADVPFADVVRNGVRAGEFPPGTPEEFGVVIDRANAEAQRRLADQVPGTRHVTETESGHNMMIDRPVLVINAIRDVVAAVRDGRTSSQ